MSDSAEHEIDLGTHSDGAFFEVLDGMTPFNESPLTITLPHIPHVPSIHSPGSESRGMSPSASELLSRLHSFQENTSERLNLEKTTRGQNANPSRHRSTLSGLYSKRGPQRGQHRLRSSTNNTESLPPGTSIIGSPRQTWATAVVTSPVDLAELTNSAKLLEEIQSDTRPMKEVISDSVFGDHQAVADCRTFVITALSRFYSVGSLSAVPDTRNGKKDDPLDHSVGDISSIPNTSSRVRELVVDEALSPGLADFDEDSDNNTDDQISIEKQKKDEMVCRQMMKNLGGKDGHPIVNGISTSEGQRIKKTVHARNFHDNQERVSTDITSTLASHMSVNSSIVENEENERGVGGSPMDLDGSESFRIAQRVCSQTTDDELLTMTVSHFKTQLKLAAEIEEMLLSRDSLAVMYEQLEEKARAELEKMKTVARQRK